MNAPITAFSPQPNPEAQALGTAAVPAGPYYHADWFADEREAEKLRGQPTPNVEPVPALKKSF